MDGILSIFKSIANSNNLNAYLRALDEHQSFRLENVKSNDSCIQHISQLLNQSNSVYEGLLLLQCYLEQCSLDVLDQKGVLWSSLALKALNRKDESVHSLVFDVLKILIEKSIEVPELHKSFSSNLISKICESLKSLNETSHLSALKCLETCLKLYSGPCAGSTRNAIETFLLSFIDCNEIDLVTLSGKCMHLLQQVRGVGVIYINCKTTWKSYQKKLLGSSNKLLNLLFLNCHEIYEVDLEMECLKLDNLLLSNDPIQRVHQLATRFKNILIYLNVAIREPYPIRKLFLPKRILNLVSRGLGVNCNMLKNNPIFDNIAIAALLPDIHIELFKLVETLILTLKSNLFMYYDVILGFTMETLKWTSSGKSQGFKKPYCLLRAAAYKMLTLWCKISKAGSCCETIFENIIDEMIYDITPFQSEMTLKVLSGTKKHMSKKARRQLHKAQNEKSHLVQSHSKSFDPHNVKVIYSDDDNQLLCTAALECLQNVLLSCSAFLKPSALKTLHEIVLHICLKCNQLHSINEKNHLYSNYQCRQKLYCVLEAMIINPHHLCPPPTQLVVQLLISAKIKDPSSLVRDSCANQIRTIEKLLHPQKETLYFPPDLNEIKMALAEKNMNTRLFDTDEDNDEATYVDISDDENSNEDNDEETEVDVLDDENSDENNDEETDVDISDDIQNVDSNSKNSIVSSENNAGPSLNKDIQEMKTADEQSRKKSDEGNKLSVQISNESITSKVAKEVIVINDVQLVPPISKRKADIQNCFTNTENQIQVISSDDESHYMLKKRKENTEELIISDDENEGNETLNSKSTDESFSNDLSYTNINDDEDLLEKVAFVNEFKNSD